MPKTGAEVAELIHKGELTYKNFDGEEIEAGFHSNLVGSLYTLGYKDFSTHSRCSVAYGGEHHVKHGTREVSVVTSNFMGRFTIVEVHYS